MDRYKVPTYDPTKTRILAELRNDVEPKVSQKQAAKFFALKRSDTVSDWEVRGIVEFGRAREAAKKDPES